MLITSYELIVKGLAFYVDTIRDGIKSSSGSYAHYSAVDDDSYRLFL